MPSIVSIIVTSVIFVIMLYIFFITVSEIPNMIEDKVIVSKQIENIEKQTLSGQITELSELSDIELDEYNTYSSCIITFENDLTEYKVYDLNQGQYELLDLAKPTQDQVTINYELDEKYRIVQDVKVGVIEPIPEEEPFEFNWWIFTIPIALAIIFLVGKPLINITIERHEGKESRKVQAEKSKKEKEEKQRIKKIKQEEAERKLYKKEGRSSRTAKAAQLLDEQEGKKRRK